MNWGFMAGDFHQTENGRGRTSAEYSNLRHDQHHLMALKITCHCPSEYFKLGRHLRLQLMLLHLNTNEISDLYYMENERHDVLTRIGRQCSVNEDHSPTFDNARIGI